LSGSEFQTVGQAVANVQVTKVLQRTRGTVSWFSWWQVADRRWQQPAMSETGTVIGEVCWCLVPETTMNYHRYLVLDPLGYVQPVQVVVKQLWQSTFIFSTT